MLYHCFASFKQSPLDFFRFNVNLVLRLAVSVRNTDGFIPVINRMLLYSTERCSQHANAISTKKQMSTQNIASNIHTSDTKWTLNTGNTADTNQTTALLNCRVNDTFCDSLFAKKHLNQQ